MQRVRGGNTRDGESTSKTEGSSSFLIRAIQESSRPKLVSINNILRAVVQSARTVVKGTPSQRRFNFQFSEFCRVSLLGMSDMEIAVNELKRENNMNCEGEAEGIREVDFVKELAAYLASQTTAFGAQYLEHLGMAALTTTGKTTLKSTEAKGNHKRGRGDDYRQNSERHSPFKESKGSSPFLMPMSNPEENALNPSKGEEKLSNIQGLSVWLQPWTLPIRSAQGVALDRVTTERFKPEESSKVQDEVSVLDICAAPTPAEVLRLWEARESFLSTGIDVAGGSSPIASEALPLSSEEHQSMFFPQKEFKIHNTVPVQVMVDLVHSGISLLEVPFKGMI